MPEFPSIVYGMPDPEYRKVKAFSNSFLKIIAASEFPALAKQEIDDRSESDALIFGRAFHCAFGEPERFESEYIALPENAPKRPTTAQIKSLTGKKPNPETIALCAWWDEWNEITKGKETISLEKFDLIRRMGDSARSHPEIIEFLQEETHFEVSAFADTVCSDGTKLKCRADAVNSRMLDLKSIDGITTSRIEKAIGDCFYHMQHPIYMDIFEEAGKSVYDFRFVFVDKNSPHITRVVALPQEAVNLGRREYFRAIETAKDCIEMDYWPGPMPITETIGLSNWVIRKRTEKLDES